MTTDSINTSCGMASKWLSPGTGLQQQPTSVESTASLLLWFVVCGCVCCVVLCFVLCFVLCWFMRAVFVVLWCGVCLCVAVLLCCVWYCSVLCCVCLFVCLIDWLLVCLSVSVFDLSGERVQVRRCFVPRFCLVMVSTACRTHFTHEHVYVHMLRKWGGPTHTHTHTHISCKGCSGYGPTRYGRNLIRSMSTRSSHPEKNNSIV